MTEGQVQGKWVLVRNNGEFKITKFELARSNCIKEKFAYFESTCAQQYWCCVRLKNKTENEPR